MIIPGYHPLAQALIAAVLCVVALAELGVVAWLGRDIFRMKREMKRDRR